MSVPPGQRSAAQPPSDEVLQQAWKLLDNKLGKARELLSRRDALVHEQRAWQSQGRSPALCTGQPLRTRQAAFCFGCGALLQP